MSQDYENVEIIVSDNASTDETRNICQSYCNQDTRVKYFRQPSNLGPVVNFATVLRMASGEYFMWLGDDDWIDPSYVKHCASLLIADSNLALVSGTPIYYRDGKKDREGKVFDLSGELWASRVARYYKEVADNGMFYGVMRTAQLQQVVMPNSMGGDWHLMASIVSIGKTEMCSAVTVHREMGGATVSYREIVRSLGLPSIQAVFPMTTIALGAVRNIAFAGVVFKKRSLLTRILLAGVVFLLVISRPTSGYTARVKRLLRKVKNILKRSILLLINGANNK